VFPFLLFTGIFVLAFIWSLVLGGLSAQLRREIIGVILLPVPFLLFICFVLVSIELSL
jgi:hypothetical protein